MKKIGFVDYISELHANSYPAWIKELCEESGDEKIIQYERQKNEDRCNYRLL